MTTTIKTDESKIQCKNCFRFCYFYSNLGALGYKKLHRGFCRKHFVDKKECAKACDDFICAKEQHASRKASLLAALEKSLHSINCIAEILTME